METLVVFWMTVGAVFGPIFILLCVLSAIKAFMDRKGIKARNRARRERGSMMEVTTMKRTNIQVIEDTDKANYWRQQMAKNDVFGNVCSSGRKDYDQFVEDNATISNGQSKYPDRRRFFQQDTLQIRESGTDIVGSSRIGQIYSVGIDNPAVSIDNLVDQVADAHVSMKSSPKRNAPLASIEMESFDSPFCNTLKSPQKKGSNHQHQEPNTIFQHSRKQLSTDLDSPSDDKTSPSRKSYDDCSERQSNTSSHLLQVSNSPPDYEQIMEKQRSSDPELSLYPPNQTEDNGGAHTYKHRNKSSNKNKHYRRDFNSNRHTEKTLRSNHPRAERAKVEEVKESKKRENQDHLLMTGANRRNSYAAAIDDEVVANEMSENRSRSDANLRRVSSTSLADTSPSAQVVGVEGEGRINQAFVNSSERFNSRL